MNLVADESVGAQIVERLRKDGHAVGYIAEMAPGISDETVLKARMNRKLRYLLATKTSAN